MATKYNYPGKPKAGDKITNPKGIEYTVSRVRKSLVLGKRAGSETEYEISHLYANSASAGKSQSATRTKSKRGAKPTRANSTTARSRQPKKKKSSPAKSKRSTQTKRKKSTTAKRIGSPVSIRRLKGGAKKLSIVVAGALKRKEFGAAFEAINKLSRALAPIASITAQSAWNIEAVFKGRAVDPSDVLPYLQRNSESFDTGKRTLAIGVQLANGLFQILSHKAHTLDNALGEYEDNRTIYEENLYGETD